MASCGDSSIPVHIMDLGCGSGLLSILACKALTATELLQLESMPLTLALQAASGAGVEHFVTACDDSAGMCDVTRRTAAANGCDSIHVHHADCTKLELESKVPENLP